MVKELWGAGPDARRAGGPVVLCAALGVASFALAFTGALLLGRGVTGSAVAALLLPLALSGALAVGLAVTFVVAVALSQPYAVRRAARMAAVVTPLAALAMLFVYAADPGAPVNRAAGAAPPLLDHHALPGRSVAVPATPRTRVAKPVAAPPAAPAPAPDRAGPVAFGPPSAAPAPPVVTVDGSPDEPVLAPVAPAGEPSEVLPGARAHRLHRYRGATASVRAWPGPKHSKHPKHRVYRPTRAGWSLR